MVLNPNENYREVEKPAKSFPKPSPTEPLDEPAEKRERRDEKGGKRRRDVYEKYRNPQKETETERIPVRVSREFDGGREGSSQGYVARKTEGWMFVVGGGRGGTDTGVDGSDSSGSRRELGDGPRVRNVGGRNLGFARYAEGKKNGKKVREEDGRRPESEGREGNVR